MVSFLFVCRLQSLRHLLQKDERLCTESGRSCEFLTCSRGDFDWLALLVQSQTVTVSNDLPPCLALASPFRHAATRFVRSFRLKNRDVIAVDRKGDDVIRVAMRLRLDDHFHETRRFFLAGVDSDASAKEPVARMFAIRLRQVEAFDASRIATYRVAKQGRIAIQIPFVEGETHLTIGRFQCVASFGENVDFSRRGPPFFCLRGEVGDRGHVAAFGHAIV